MFRKLKIELILINLILTGLVLIIIFSGIYVLMERSFEHSSYMHMAKTSEMEDIPPLLSVQIESLYLQKTFLLKRIKLVESEKLPAILHYLRKYLII